MMLLLIKLLELIFRSCRENGRFVVVLLKGTGLKSSCDVVYDVSSFYVAQTFFDLIKHFTLLPIDRYGYFLGGSFFPIVF